MAKIVLEEVERSETLQIEYGEVGTFEFLFVTDWEGTYFDEFLRSATRLQRIESLNKKTPSKKHENEKSEILQGLFPILRSALTDSVENAEIIQDKKTSQRKWDALDFKSRSVITEAYLSWQRKSAEELGKK